MPGGYKPSKYQVIKARERADKEGKKRSRMSRDYLFVYDLINYPLIRDKDWHGLNISKYLRRIFPKRVENKWGRKEVLTDFLKESKFVEIKNSNFEGFIAENLYIKQLWGSNVNMSHSRLANSNFSKAKLEAWNFNDSDLSGIDFSDAHLVKVTFVKSDLSGANFRNADLKDCDFTGANVKGAVFDGAKIEGVIGLKPWK